MLLPKGKKSLCSFLPRLGAAFQAALLRRTYHRLHHNPDRFPNRSLYSILRSSEMTTTIEIRTCLSMSPAKMMQLGMHSTSHEKRQILKRVVADIPILMTSHHLMTRVCNPRVFQELPVEVLLPQAPWHLQVPPTVAAPSGPDSKFTFCLKPTLLQTPTSLPRPSLPATFAIMTWNNPK